MRWTKERSAQAHAAKERLRVERAEAGLVEHEWVRVPKGEYLGTLQWHDASGQVRRWVIRQGDRANNISVQALVFGCSSGRLYRTWTWLSDRLRRVLCPSRKRLHR